MGLCHALQYSGPLNVSSNPKEATMWSILSRILGSAPKRIVAGAIVALAAALPVATSAADAVQIEANTGVANVTAGDTAYKGAVKASYDQVVKLQVTYNNKEAADSGKVAQNLRVKIAMPTKAGATQQIATTTSADNSNTVVGSATVNTGRTDAQLQYEPGTAVWAHADKDGKVTTENLGVKGDAIVSANGAVLEDENPCQAGSVTILARVVVPGVKIVKQSELATESNKWSSNNTAKPGDTLKYLISYQNTGNTAQSNVIIRDSLPPHMTLVPGTTKLANSTYPQSKAVSSDDVVNGGIVIGNYGAGANAYVTFEVKIDAADKLACGNNEFRNVGVAHPQGMSEYYNTAITMAHKDCSSTPSNPSYSCNLLSVSKQSGREIEATVDYTAKDGATFKTATYDFGDGSDALTTDKTNVQHTYAKDGDYTVTAKLLFSVNGKDQVVNADDCAKTVSFASSTAPSTPTSGGAGASGGLPNTGAGNVIALFAGASVVGATAYRLFLSRRFARQ